MTKKIHTIQSSNKTEFDEKVNFFLGYGCELMDNSYEIINKGDSQIYSQVISYDDSEIDMTFDEDGDIKHIGKLKNGNKNGLWIFWGHQGHRYRESNYKNGELDGMDIHWHNYDKKRKEKEANYNDGKLEGLYTEWWENGQKNKEITYKNNVMNGPYKYWYDNGQKVAEATYIDNYIFHGLYTSWHKNGYKVKEGIYIDGKKWGVWTLWHEDDGTKYGEHVYENDKIIEYR